MSGTATLVKDLGHSKSGARQKLYRLDPPVAGKGWNGLPTAPVEFVCVSAVVAYSGPETYIFPANAEGEVTSWSEMDGSERGTLDHDTVLRAAGYEPVYPAKVEA